MGWRFRTMAMAAVAAALCVAPTAARAQYGYEQPALAPMEPPEAHDAGGGGDTWSQVGWGALAVAGNLLYVPAKLAYAGIGGVTGGLAYGLTGGDGATARQIWEPSLGGDYFLTPDMIQGQEGVSFAGAPAELTAPAPKPEAVPASGYDAPPPTGYETPSSGYDPPPAEYGAGDSDYGN